MGPQDHRLHLILKTVDGRDFECSATVAANHRIWCPRTDRLDCSPWFTRFDMGLSLHFYTVIGQEKCCARWKWSSTTTRCACWKWPSIAKKSSKLPQHKPNMMRSRCRWRLQLWRPLSGLLRPENVHQPACFERQVEQCCFLFPLCGS